MVMTFYLKAFIAVTIGLYYSTNLEYRVVCHFTEGSLFLVILSKASKGGDSVYETLHRYYNWFESLH